eukprot:4801542-Prymnesium_polylepis.1
MSSVRVPRGHASVAFGSAAARMGDVASSIARLVSPPVTNLDITSLLSSVLVCARRAALSSAQRALAHMLLPESDEAALLADKKRRQNGSFKLFGLSAIVLGVS